MQTDAPRGIRHSQILNEIVRTYIETGEPVGSRTLSKSHAESLSPASIRNVMADLADNGFLDQPHTSAGRIPTLKAFRCYVASLVANRLARPISASEADRLRKELSGLPTIEARVERSSQVLMELTRNVGIAAAIPALAQELDQIELLHLGGNRVLMVLVTRDQMVRNRVLTLDEPVTPDELISVRNYVNRNFSGWQLAAARHELLRRMEEERAMYDAVERKLRLLSQNGLLAVDTAPEIHMEGASNLLGLGLHLTREKMRDLLRALEEKKRVIELLDRFLEQPPGELEVHVGLEQAHPVMRDLTLIGMTVQLASGLPAKVAVLGPVRMQYERVMAAVFETSRALQAAPF
ncbi:MAG: heat-inducible transcription repressor HrcA [Acidobacteriia bacterium]|nr:heat-inducible transcription repressor HrcA [Terriglobia bacterium]MBV8905911.1 heat-inducible transcription repressor HrcA [Terriglobia bacterium]MBV9744863.1 heat-inducible transcription repressor HrcA [Terriglobia bacterium]